MSEPRWDTWKWEGEFKAEREVVYLWFLPCMQGIKSKRIMFSPHICPAAFCVLICSLCLLVVETTGLQFHCKVLSREKTRYKVTKLNGSQVCGKSWNDTCQQLATSDLKDHRKGKTAGNDAPNYYLIVSMTVRQRVKLLFQRGCLAWCVHEMMWSDKSVRASPLLCWWRLSSCFSAETVLICWAQKNPVGESCCTVIYCICLRCVCPRFHFRRENPSHSYGNTVWSEVSWAGKEKEEEHSRS